MSTPVGTGAVARLLQLSEPQLNEHVRKGRIRNPPPVVAGRRFWSRSIIRAAAADLEIEIDEAELARLTPTIPTSIAEVSP